MTDELLTSKQVVGLLGVNERTLIRNREVWGLKPVPYEKKQIRYRRADVDAYLASVGKSGPHVVIELERVLLHSQDLANELMQVQLLHKVSSEVMPAYNLISEFQKLLQGAIETIKSEVE